MNLLTVNWPAVVAAAIARGYVQLPPPGPSPTDKVSTPRVKKFRDQREYHRRRRQQHRAALRAKGLTAVGTPPRKRDLRAIPELDGLVGREKHRVYMQLLRHGKI